MLFATYGFLMKLQMHDNDRRQPTLGQIFLAGAGCGPSTTMTLGDCPILKERWHGNIVGHRDNVDARKNVGLV